MLLIGLGIPGAVPEIPASTCSDFKYHPATTNFSWASIQSHGHSHPDYALFNTALGTILESIYSTYAISIIATGPDQNRVYSCPIHNSTIAGAAAESQHIYGDAADIHSTSTDWQAIRTAIYGMGSPYSNLCAEPNDVSGNGHVHIDLRGNMNSYSGDNTCSSTWHLP